MPNRRIAALIRCGTTHGSKGVRVIFIRLMLGFAGMSRGKVGVAWRVACRKVAGSEMQRPWRRSACGGLPLFLRFSGDRCFHGGARIRKARRGRDDLGQRRLGFREQCGERVEHRADHFGGGHGRGLQGLVVIEHPSGEHGFGRFLDPLVDQGGNFLTEIRGVVQACQLKTLQ
jgi:hypothetical protein